MNKTFLTFMLLLCGGILIPADQGQDDAAWQPGEQGDFIMWVDQSVQLFSMMQRRLQQPSSADPALRVALLHEAAAGINVLNVAAIIAYLPEKPLAYHDLVRAIQQHNLVRDYFRNDDKSDADVIQACWVAVDDFNVARQSCLALHKALLNTCCEVCDY